MGASRTRWREDEYDVMVLVEVDSFARNPVELNHISGQVRDFKATWATEFGHNIWWHRQGAGVVEQEFSRRCEIVI